MTDEPKSEPIDSIEAARQALQADAKQRADVFIAGYQALCKQHRCSMQPILYMSPAGVQWSMQPVPES